jgi:hypothetical protein
MARFCDDHSSSSSFYLIYSEPIHRDVVLMRLETNCFD